ncbi:MAG: hypothetical protein ACYC4U_01035 [Pirellulaceae bacterium]
MEPLLCSVDDIESADRQALEHLLGRPLKADQKVFIMAFTPGETPDAVVREQARARLQETLAATERHASDTQVTADEADAALEEAMLHVRPRSA